MRAYFFGNMYLSSIQQGIQAAHVVADMFIKYKSDDGQQADMLIDWAENHKTMILLNGGYGETLRGLIEFFDNSENPYPWESFNEGKDSLDGALTDVGIILPEKIYDTAALIRGRNGQEKLDIIQRTGSLKVVTDTETVIRVFDKWEFELLQKLNTFGMAK